MSLLRHQYLRLTSRNTSSRLHSLINHSATSPDSLASKYSNSFSSYSSLLDLISNSCSSTTPLNPRDPSYATSSYILGDIRRSLYPDPNSFLRLKVVPEARIFPEAITRILSLRQSASSMLCVVRMMDLFFLRSLMRFHVSLLTLGSMPVVGSSMMMTSESPMKLIARDILLFIPPENVFTWPFLFLESWNSSRILSILSSRLGTSLRFPKSLRCSYAVRSSQRMSNCGQTPIFFLMVSMEPSMLKPHSLADPPSKSRIPVRMPIKVDLPAPFFPRIETISCLSTSKEVPLSAKMSSFEEIEKGYFLQCFCSWLTLTKHQLWFSITTSGLTCLNLLHQQLGCRKNKGWQGLPLLEDMMWSKYHTSTMQIIDVRSMQRQLWKALGITYASVGSITLPSVIWNKSLVVNSFPSIHLASSMSKWLSAFLSMSLKILEQWKEGQMLKNTFATLIRVEVAFWQMKYSMNPPVNTHCITMAYNTKPQLMLMPIFFSLTRLTTRYPMSDSSTPLDQNTRKSNHSSPCVKNLI